MLEDSDLALELVNAGTGFGEFASDVQFLEWCQMLGIVL
jgi:hypothetical protein